MTPSRSDPPAGSVAFTVLHLPLSEGGLRVLMGLADGVVAVAVRGLSAGSNGVEVCPVAGVAGSPGAGRCVVAGPGGAVDLAVGGGADGGPAGVLVRPLPGAPATGAQVGEVTFTYRPDGDSLTVVTPSLPSSEGSGDCPGQACEMVIGLTPTGRGTLEMRSDGRGARPQLTLRSGVDGAGSSRVVSIVEGGGRLRIQSTVEGPEGVTLTLRNLGPAELPPLELSLVWPVLR